jgi:SAM-dependent methyltransferase
VSDAIFSQQVLVNLGAGTSGQGRIPPVFHSWRHVRVDIDPDTRPDVVADLTDLSPIPDHTADVVWASHCVEHLFRHQVETAFREIRRILKPEGMAFIFVPDLQAVAKVIAEDRLQEVIYDSAAGPITAHDVVFGFGKDVEHGRVHMAHRTGFTPSLLVQSLTEAGFSDFIVRRRTYELVAFVRKTPWASDAARQEQLGRFGI